jgi:hypothetical protein
MNNKVDERPDLKKYISRKTSIRKLKHSASEIREVDQKA